MFSEDTRHCFGKVPKSFSLGDSFSYLFWKRKKDEEEITEFFLVLHIAWENFHIYQRNPPLTVRSCELKMESSRRTNKDMTHELCYNLVSLRGL